MPKTKKEQASGPSQGQIANILRDALTVSRTELVTAVMSEQENALSRPQLERINTIAEAVNTNILNGALDRIIRLYE
jgi:hypothetical protein